MPVERKDSLVIGLTGSFGSGCSTLRDVLASSDFRFKPYKLSKYVREEWEKLHGKSADKAPRRELQDLGNRMRKESRNYSILAKKALEDADQENDGEVSLVFDSIRNTAEIGLFRKEFANFFLIAVDCEESDRWERVEKDYKKLGIPYTHDEFVEDDERDKNEVGVVYGQQVQLCVDEADILIRNPTTPLIVTDMAIKGRLREKISFYITLLKGELRTPTEPECYMNMAYSVALRSGCFKRQVGAVIVAAGNVISAGCNENPPQLEPCFRLGDCYRDGYIEESMSKIKFCPFCGQKVEDALPWPFECPNCKKNLYKELIRDKALSRCTALHAEERAIIKIGATNLEGATLYTTTFPCFMCANKILEVGIKTIWYADSYPDLESKNLLNEVKTVKVVPFEGVKGRLYGRLFGAWRRGEEEKIMRKRMEG